MYQLFDWAIVLFDKTDGGVLKILYYGSSRESSAKSVYVLNKIEQYAKIYGSKNILVIENLPIQITHSGSFIEFDERSKTGTKVVNL